MSQSRHGVSRHGSKSLFSATADRVHSRNAPTMVMRGGIRL